MSFHNSETTRLNEINRAVVLMDADFRQIAARQFRTQGDEPSNQFLIWQDALLGRIKGESYLPVWVG